MATLTVWKFPTAGGAEEAIRALTSDAVVDRVRGAFEGMPAELLETDLSADQEAKPREAFAED